MMFSSSHQFSETRPASPAAVLATNLVAARMAAGLTQHALSAAADVARATIAQLEAGLGDPRLSTISALAQALGVSPAVLLFGHEHIGALGRLVATAPQWGASVEFDSTERARLRLLAASGMIRRRNRAARLAASAATRAGLGRSAAVYAGLLCPLDADLGLAFAAALAPADIVHPDEQSATIVQSKIYNSKSN